MADGQKKSELRSPNRRFVENFLTDIPFATAIWNFFIREGKAVKHGWIAFLFIAIIFGWIGYSLADYKKPTVSAMVDVASLEGMVNSTNNIINHKTTDVSVSHISNLGQAMVVVEDQENS